MRKIKIKVRRIKGNQEIKIIDKGDWIDLAVASDITLKGPIAETLHRKKGEDDVVNKFRSVTFPEAVNIPLGVAMQLPKGYEAIIVPRSSTYKKYGIICVNSLGVIDYTYSGNDDEWKFPALAMRDTKIKEGTRICQFKIQLSQKATMWQKINWLLASKIEIEYVDHLSNVNRGGFGITGIN